MKNTVLQPPVQFLLKSSDTVTIKNNERDGFKIVTVNADKGDDFLLGWISINVLLHGKISVRVASVGIMCTSRQDIQTAL